MPTQKKIDDVAELKARIEDSQLAVLTQYVGANVSQMTGLRKLMRDADVEFKVYKNNLAAIALKELGLEEAASFMEGPTAWAFSKDPVAPAKILKDSAREVKFLQMVGGVLEGKVVSKEQMEALAALPPREVLLAQVVGTVQAPLRSLVGVLSAVPRNLVNVLDQVRKQKEEGAEAA